MQTYTYTNADEKFMLSVEAENETAAFKLAVRERHAQLVHMFPTTARQSVGLSHLLDRAVMGIVNAVMNVGNCTLRGMLLGGGL